jgi:hypothetical protein
MACSSPTSWLSSNVEHFEGDILAQRVSELVNLRIKSGVYGGNDAMHIHARPLPFLSSTVDLSEEETTVLRNVARASQITLRPPVITSHRRVVGPFIVLLKRMLFPIVSMFLKDYVRQQAEFQSLVVHALLVYAERKEKGDGGR